MKHKHNITAFCCLICFLFLITNSETAISGMREGITLCLYTLLPALFPYMVLSILVTGSILGSEISFLAPVSSLCRIPKGCESLLAVGILGGYPVGAQNVCLAWKAGNITKDNAQRLAVFCNNAGPAFIFGILGPIFHNTWVLLLLWGIQILSAVLTGALIPGGNDQADTLPDRESPSVTGAIMTATRSALGICSCVVLFRMLQEFFQLWVIKYLPKVAEPFIIGILELSNGCILLMNISHVSVRFVLASGLLSFGGLCVWMQTVSVCKRLNMNHYLRWKLIQSGISVILSLIIIIFYDHIFAGILLLSAFSLLIMRFSEYNLKNRSSFPRKLDV